MARACSCVPAIVLHILLIACNDIALAENHSCAKPESQRGMQLLQSRKHRDAKKKLTDLVSRAYYINLEFATDRRDSSEAQLQELQRSTGLSYERFPAVYGKNDSWVRSMSEGYNRTIGSLGCFKSHILAWRKALADQPAQAWALMLEDDAVLNATLLEQDLVSYLAVMPQDADIVLLGSWDYVRDEDVVAPSVYNASGPFFVESPDNPGVGRNYYAGLHAYLIKLSSVDKLADHSMKQLNMSDRCTIVPDCATQSSSLIHKYAIWPVIAERDLARFGSERTNIDYGADS